MDSPKVPEGARIFKIGVCANCGALPGHERHATCPECRLVTVPAVAVLVSALLSDEVVEALRRRRFPTTWPSFTGEKLAEQQEAIRGDLQAVIEQVGGAGS